MIDTPTPKKRRLTKHISAHHKEKVAASAVFVLALALIALFSLGAVMTNMLWQSHTREEAHEQTTTKTTTTEDAPEFDLYIKSSSFSSGDQTFAPAPGKQFIIVDISLTHHRDTSVWLTPVLQSYITDKNNTHHGLSPLIVKDPFDARSYQPEESASGQLTYQIPINASDLRFCYTLSATTKATCVAI